MLSFRPTSYDPVSLLISHVIQMHKLYFILNFANNTSLSHRNSVSELAFDLASYSGFELSSTAVSKLASPPVFELAPNSVSYLFVSNFVSYAFSD
jgi:hypothetical protein